MSIIAELDYLETLGIVKAHDTPAGMPQHTPDDVIIRNRYSNQGVIYEIYHVYDKHIYFLGCIAADILSDGIKEVIRYTGHFQAMGYTEVMRLDTLLHYQKPNEATA